MREMLLLGAGASIEADVPGSFKMTKAILANLRANLLYKKQAHVLSFVVGGLLFEAGKNDLNPLEHEINVEDLFNAVQLLAERGKLEAAPFIGSWHSFIDDLDKIYPSKPSGNLQRLIYEAIAKEILSAFSQNPSAFRTDKIDSALASNIRKNVEATIKNRSVSLSSADNVGSAISVAVERYLKDLTEKWSKKLKSPSFSGSDKIKEQITRSIKASQAYSGEGRIFHDTNELMIAALKDLVWIEDTNKVAYLSPILNLLQKQEQEVTIATLNYDNSIELLASSQGVNCSIQLIEQPSQPNGTVSSGGIQLLKLHGSIDWIWQEGRAGENVMPVSKVRRVNPDEVKQPHLRPAVIFGNRNKLTANGPFLALLHKFGDELGSHDRLTVVGYSFRDPHINIYLSQWLNNDSHRTLYIVNGPDFTNSHFQPDVAPYVRDLLAFASASPQRVHIISRYAGEGLRELYGERAFALHATAEVKSQPALERLAEEGKAITTEVSDTGEADTLGADFEPD